MDRLPSSSHSSAQRKIKKPFLLRRRFRFSIDPCGRDLRRGAVAAILGSARSTPGVGNAKAHRNQVSW
uniref:Uncharacterized protein n=1 Tax=Setaria viridis TaxID=4556 RepID=A0A4U6W4V8_SETVI|nr:hypothetical protein SEVIR_1G056500v2 [Setaria viridis]